MLIDIKVELHLYKVKTNSYTKCQVNIYSKAIEKNLETKF